MVGRRLTALFICIGLLSEGCAHADDPAPSPRATTSTSSAGSLARASFCVAYSTEIAQEMVRIRGPGRAQTIAEQMAMRPPVTPRDLQAIAPFEVRSWAQSVGRVNALDPAGLQYASTSLDFQNIVSLNNWAIVHCDPKYRPIYDEYRAIIN